MCIFEIWVTIYHVPECTWQQGPVWGAVPVVRHLYNEENWTYHNSCVKPVSSNKYWSINVRAEAQNLFECATSAIRQVRERKFALLSIPVTFCCVYSEHTQKLPTHIHSCHAQAENAVPFFCPSFRSLLLVTVTICTDLMPLMHQYSCPIPHLSPWMLFRDLVCHIS